MPAKQPMSGVVHLRLTHHPDETKKNRFIGEFVIDRQGIIRTFPADTNFADYLTEVAALSNKKERLYVPAVPPPGENPHANVSRIVKRGDPDFVETLIEKLIASLKYQGITAQKR
jgi:hypothetical protein